MSKNRMSAFKSLGFLLSPRESAQQGFKHYLVGGWTLSYSTALTITELNVSGFDQALLLSVVPPTDLDPEQEYDIDSVNDLAIGGYVLILSANGTLRLQQDACGSMPVVYSKETGEVASCPSMILDMPYDEALKALTVDDNPFLPFSLTAKPGVKRLLPNHVLKLPDFTTERYWNIDALSRDLTLDDVAGPIVAEFKRVLASLSKTAPILMPLTAGRDSRVLAGCADGIENLETFISVIDSAADWDREVGSQVAAFLNRPYEVRQLVEVTRSEREEFLEDTGYSFGGRVTYGFLTGPRNPEAWHVNGHHAGIGKNFYHTFQNNPVSPSDILKALKLDKVEVFLAATEEWLEPLGHLDGRQLADVLFIEALSGCWSGPQIGSPSVVRGRIAPYGQRRIVDLILRTNPEERERKRLPHRLLEEVDYRLLGFRFEPHGRRETVRCALVRLGLPGLARRVM